MPWRTRRIRTLRRGPAGRTRMLARRVPYDYRVYGLTLRANQPLPHLVATPTRCGASGPDAWFELGQACTPEDALQLRFADERGELRFGISVDGRRVWCDWSGAAGVATIDDVAGMLVGPVLACARRLRGELSLHGSVVGVGGRAIVLLGPKGSGKSTTAAAFAEAGHCVLSDDVAAVGRHRETWVVHPGYPGMRLEPLAAGELGLESTTLPAVFTGIEKRHVPLARSSDDARWKFGSDRLEVGAVYTLDRRRGIDHPEIQPLAGAAGLITLMRNRSAQAFIPHDRRREAREFAALALLGAEIPVRRVTCPDSLQRLGLLRDLLLEDAAAHC